MSSSLPNCNYFFRDDDADRLVPELYRLLGLFASRRARLSLAVIPGSLTTECAALLMDSAPEVELHQHGWMHTNHETHGRKCEFGPGRSLSAQRDDIRRGWERLHTMLRGRAAPVFTPPWNRCTEDTCQALGELGFTTLSKDATPPFAQSPLRERSISVDIFQWKPEFRLRSREAVRAQIDRAAERGRPVGILLHHKVMNSAAFELVEELLDDIPRHHLQILEGACVTAR